MKTFQSYGSSSRLARRMKRPTRVMLEDDAVLRLVLLLEAFLQGLGVLAHAAELVELEVASVATDAHLAEDYRPGAGELDRNGDGEEDRREEDHADRAAEDVDQALERVGAGDGEAPRLEPEAPAGVAAAAGCQFANQFVQIRVGRSV